MRRHTRTHAHSLSLAATVFAQFTSLYWLRSPIRQKLGTFRGHNRLLALPAGRRAADRGADKFERPEAERGAERRYAASLAATPNSRRY